MKKLWLNADKRHKQASMRVMTEICDSRGEMHKTFHFYIKKSIKSMRWCQTWLFLLSISTRDYCIHKKNHIIWWWRSRFFCMRVKHWIIQKNVTINICWYFLILLTVALVMFENFLSLILWLAQNHSIFESHPHLIH